MEHRTGPRKLYHPVILDAHKKAVRIFLSKKDAEAAEAIAGRAVGLAKKEKDKLAAHGLACLSPISPSRVEDALAVVRMETAGIPEMKAEEHISSVGKHLEEYSAIKLADLAGAKASEYERMLIKGEVSPVAIMVRIAELERKPESALAEQLLYVYSPVAELIEPAIGNELRKAAVSILYPAAFCSVLDGISKKRAEIAAAKEKAERLVGIAGAKVRTKRPESMVLKLVTRGHLNDVVAFRLVHENEEEAAQDAKRILAKIAGKVDIDDYYMNPKPSGFRAININFMERGIGVEIQLTDEKSDKDAQSGDAAHAIYKSMGRLTPKIVPVFKKNDS